MTSEAHNFDADVLEELTAYLDGELDPADQQRVELRLSTDTQYRHELQQLQQTWDALDNLPTPQPNHSFTQSTLELVVHGATREVRKAQNNMMAWPARALILLGIPLVTCLVSYLCLNYYREAPNRQLLNNLPLIENLQMYQSAGSIEFLQALAVAEPDESLLDEPEVSSSLEMTYQQRKELVQSYDVRQLDHLDRQRQLFTSLTPKELIWAKQFQADLSAHENSAELTETLYSFNNWLTTLESPEKKAALLDKPIAERIELIREIRFEQQTLAFGSSGDTRLPDGDVSYVFNWITRLFISRRPLIAERVKNLVYAGKITIDMDRVKRFGALRVIFQADPDFINELITDDDILKLESGLSTEAKQIFAGRSRQELETLMKAWFVAASEARLTVTDSQIENLYRHYLDEQEQLELLTSNNIVSKAAFRKAVSDKIEQKKADGTLKRIKK